MTGLQAGQRGIDFAVRPDDDGGIKANGAAFIVRYSAGANNATPDRQFKLCKPSEVRDAVAAGLDFLANYEDGPGTLANSTPTQMSEAGKADLEFWQSRGYAKGAVLLCSWDTGQPDPSLHATVARNLDAYFTAQSDYYARGFYGGDIAMNFLLDQQVIGYGWRAMSDDWSGDGSFYRPGPGWAAEVPKLAAASRAHIAQNGNTWYGPEADEDVVLRAGLPSHLSQINSAPPAPKPHPAPAPAPKPHPAPAPLSYTVRPGDTLGKIASKFRVSGGYEHLAVINHLPNPDRIYVGQVLRIIGTAPAGHSYTVRSGDYLSAIAARFGTTWQRLAAINHLVDPNRIFPGEVLRVA